MDEFISADEVRQVTKESKQKEARLRKEAAMRSEYYKEVTSWIREAAGEGENSIVFYPKAEEYFNELFENHKIFPEEDKKFSAEQMAVFQALEEFGGFKFSLIACPVCYDTEGATQDRIQQATIYW